MTLPNPQALAVAATEARGRMMAIAAGRADAWESSLLNMGTQEDKIASLRYSGLVMILTDPILEAMFMTEIYSYRGVCIYPDTAFSEGVKFMGTSDEDATKDYLDEEWRVSEVCNEAAVWGRLYGGCATWVVTDRGYSELQEPLDPGEEILALRNVERPFVVPIQDPDTFDAAGHPQYFMLNPPQGHIHATVHISRLVLWPGDRTPQRRRIQRGYWDLSVLQRPYDVLKRNGHVSQAAQQLLSEASIGVFKVQDLWQATSSGAQAQMLTRIKRLNMFKGNSRALVVDKDKEDFTRVNTTFAGVADLTDRARQEVAAAFGIPVTRLMGEAPAGLNATGDSDERNFQKDVSAYQRHALEPRVKKLAKILLDANQAPVKSKGLTIAWPDLWAPTAKESAEIYSTTASADGALIDREVITPEQARSRFKPEGYSETLDLTPPTDEEGEPLDPADLKGTSEGGNTPDGGTPGDEPMTLAIEPAALTALSGIVADVAAKKIPRDAGAQLIAVAFGVTPEKAGELLGTAGAGFEPPAPPAPPGFGAKPGAPPPKPGEKAPPKPAEDDAKADRADHIDKEGDKFVVYNEARTRSFGSYDSKEEAEKRLAEMEAHKDGFDENEPRDEHGEWSPEGGLKKFRDRLENAKADHEAMKSVHSKEPSEVTGKLVDSRAHLVDFHAKNLRRAELGVARARVENARGDLEATKAAHEASRLTPQHDEHLENAYRSMTEQAERAVSAHEKHLKALEKRPLST